MPINESFIQELEQEAKTTRKILERVPLDKSDWKPHQKSTALGRLATHIAEIPGWTSSALEYDELDFAKFDFKPTVAASTAELLKILDDNVIKAKKSLQKASDDEFTRPWTMRNGEHVYFTIPKINVLRNFSYNHWYHHRAQLGVYLRLLDVPLPNIYGPTADEQM